MAPCLSKFPSLCLEAIFKHLPLVDLYYSVGLVCSSWYNSRRTELMRRCRLVLVADTKQHYLNEYRVHSWNTYGTDLMERVRREDGSPWHRFESLERFKFNLLLVPGAGGTAHLFSSLVGINFCAITRLFIVHNCTDSILTDVARLLDQLSERLVDLKLKLSDPYFDYTDFWGKATAAVQDNDYTIIQHLPDNMASLIICLNDRLPALRHLKLHLFFGRVRFHLPPLTCLSRLATFDFPVNQYQWVNEWFFASLYQYAQADNNISLEFTSTHHTNMINVQDIPQMDNNNNNNNNGGQLEAKFKAFSVNYGNDAWFGLANVQPYDALRQFCSRFSGLTKLALQADYFSLSMVKVARCLSLVPELAQLDIRIRLLRVEQAREQEEEDIIVITQLPSVRLLSLCFAANSHLVTERLLIADIFPNLQVLRLRLNIFRCEVCGIAEYKHRFDAYNDDDDEMIDEPGRVGRMAECARLARMPFGRCANLHTIELVDGKFGSKKSLINVN